MYSLKTKNPKYYFYHGRKITKRISLSKKNLINKIYNQYSFDEQIIQYHENKSTSRKIVFPENFDRVNIEIGFGNGEFLLKNAVSQPKELFIGVEVYLNGIVKVLTAISEKKIKNIILSNLNSYYFLKAVPNKSVDKVFIINPDPWFKKRHKKRRLMSYDTIKLLTKIIKPKKITYMTTDSKEYIKDTEDMLNNIKDFTGNYNVTIMTKNDELYGISRYQRKAIEKGGKIYLLTF